MTTLEFVRHFRLFGYAIFDLIVSFIGIYLLSGILSKIFRKINIDIPKINWVYLTLPIGIVIHLFFGTMTPMVKNFLDLNSGYILKVVILLFCVLGFKGIKIINNK